LAASASRAGGLGNLLRGVGKDGKALGGGEVLSALGALGGVVAGGAAVAASLRGLLGRREPSAAELADLRAREANTEALRALTTQLGELALADTGQALGRAAGVAGAVVTARDAFFDDFARRERERQDADPQSFRPEPTPLFDARASLARALREAGLSFADFAAQAKRLGIEVRESGEGIDAFLGATVAASTQFRTLRETWEVLGTDGVTQLREFLGVLAALPDGLADESRAVARALLESFDLATETGRAGALAAVRQAFREGALSGDVARQLVALLSGVGEQASRAAAEAAREAADAVARVFDAITAALRQIDYDQRLGGLGEADAIGQVVRVYQRQLPPAFGPARSTRSSSATARSTRRRRASPTRCWRSSGTWTPSRPG
jgi:hypothetical protein